MARITTIGFDTDNTLWHNARFFQLTQARFVALDNLAELPGWLASILGISGS